MTQRPSNFTLASFGRSFWFCLTTVVIASFSGFAHAAPNLPTDRLGRAVVGTGGEHLIYGPAPTNPIAPSVSRVPSRPSASTSRSGTFVANDAKLVRQSFESHRLPPNIPIFPPLPHLPIPNPVVPAAPRDDQFSVWQSGFLGTSIGFNGLVIGTNDGVTEIYLTGSSDPYFGANDFWSVLRKVPNGTNYEQSFVHSPYPNIVWKLVLADIVGDARPEIIVALGDGTVVFYDQRSHLEVGRMKTDPTIRSLAVADLNRDGTNEIVVLTDEDLIVYDHLGTRLWMVTGIGGSDLVVGQLDNDPALEIVTTAGVVLDGANQQVEWSSTNGFGQRLALVDVNGTGRSQFVAIEAWYNVRAYDLPSRSVVWSKQTDHDVGAVQFADVTGDGRPELLIGDGQWGQIHAYSLTNLNELWNIANPDHGVTAIAVADVDRDGHLEIFWGAGATSTGADHLFAYDVATRSPEWQSIHLDGPFIGPGLGDLDGDGRLEIVVCSFDSDAGYSSGRILVFDATNKTLRAISGPVSSGGSVEGVRDLKVRDIDGDGRPEILIGTDYWYDGRIEAYSFNTDNTFTLKWSNRDVLDGMPLGPLEVADVDGLGTAAIVTGNSRAHTGAIGTFVGIYDVATRTQVWHSADLNVDWPGVLALAVGDADGDGHLDIAAVTSPTNLFIFDARQRQLSQQIPGQFSSVAIPGTGRGLLVGSDRMVTPYRWTNGMAGAGTPWRAADGPVIGLQQLTEQWLWTAGSGYGYLWDPSGHLAWRSSLHDSEFGRQAVSFIGSNGLEVISAGLNSVEAFQPTPHASFTRVSVATTGGVLTEGEPGSSGFSFARTDVGTNDLSITFQVAGTATLNDDFVLEGATLSENGWAVTIPAGQSNAFVRVVPLDDAIPEQQEFVAAFINLNAGYEVSGGGSARVRINDNEITISVFESDPYATEGGVDGRPDPAEFTIRANRPVPRATPVFFDFVGEATPGVDFRARPGAVILQPGQDFATVSIVPIDDAIAEPAEHVTLRLRYSDHYHISPQASEATAVIEDNEPSILLEGYTIPTTRTNAAAVINLSRDRSQNAVTIHYLLIRSVPGRADEVKLAEARFPARAATLGVVVPRRRHPELSETVTFQLVPHPNYTLVGFDRTTFALLNDNSR